MGNDVTLLKKWYRKDNNKVRNIVDPKMFLVLKEHKQTNNYLYCIYYTLMSKEA